MYDEIVNSHAHAFRCCFFRMDPNSSYLLQIKLIGSQKKAGKDVQCFSFEQIIDSDLTNYMGLVESIVEKYPPGYLEVARVQYCDANLQTYPEVKSDQELMDIFEKHSMSKVVQIFIVYCDPSEPYEPKSEWHCHMQSKADSNIEQDEDHYYSIEKFKSTYGQLIPAMEDKRQWPASSHGFFMHPPLLKATTGRPKT